MAAKETGWRDIYTKTLDGHAVTVSKAFINAKAEYTVRFGAEKKDGKDTYISPNIPFATVSLQKILELFASAEALVLADIAKDDEAERDRIKALSAKPGSVIHTRPPTTKTAAGPAAPRVPNGPRATGKTAKKKAKLQARADEARAAASK